jgi:hypothetical protein
MKIKILIAILMLLAIQSFAADMSDVRANQIADAIYKVEGGSKTKHPYGILSVKTSNPRQVCLNTIRNNYIRWQKSGSKGDYLDYLANIYCPKSADPQGNKNWKVNIHKLVP